MSTITRLTRAIATHRLHAAYRRRAQRTATHAHGHAHQAQAPHPIPPVLLSIR